MLRFRDDGLEFRLFGWLPVWMHWSLPAIVLLMNISLWKTSNSLTAAALVIPGIMLSVLAHELGHALAARRFGLDVTAIHLHGGGGQAIIAGWVWSRRVNMLITGAGPAANVAIGVLCLAAYFAFWGSPYSSGGTLLVTKLPAVVRPFWATALWWLGIFNVVIAFVNLLPAFPLDGGQLATDLLDPRIGAIKTQYLISVCGIMLAVLTGIVLFMSVLAGVPIVMPPYMKPNLNAFRAAREGRQMRSE